MHIILCLDDRNGMFFNHRRLSSDRVVCQRIAENASGKLWMNSYSAKLFADYEVCVDEEFLQKAAAGDTCFVESPDFAETAEDIQSITVYRWNRAYPADQKLPDQILTQWQMTASVDFPGNSHEIITEEKYTN